MPIFPVIAARYLSLDSKKWLIGNSMSGRSHKNWDKNLASCQPRVVPVYVGKDKNRKNPLRQMQNVSDEPWML